MKDPILDEVHRAKEQIAAEYQYDPWVALEDAQKRDRTWGMDVVSYTSGCKEVIFKAPRKPRRASQQSR
jgi:hypothetical protein